MADGWRTEVTLTGWKLPVRGGTWSKLVGAAAVVFLGTLAGRAMGFVREITLAAELGVGSEADAAVIAFTFPDLLIGLLIAGSSSTVLIPEFERLRQAEPGWPRRFALKMGVYALLGAAVVTFLVAILALPIARVLAPGMSADVTAETAGLLRIAGFAFPPFAVLAVTTAYLHHLGRFSVPALAAFIYNVVVVAAIWFWLQPGALYPLPIAVVIGAVVIVVTQIVASARWADRSRAPALPHLGSGLARRYLQALATGSAIALLPFLARAAASTAGEGGVATLNFAQKMTDLPNGTILAAIAVPLFPAISGMLEAGRDAEFLQLARRGAMILLGAGMAVALVVAVPAHLWADLLYGRGSVTSEETSAIGSVARVVALGLPAQGMNAYLVSIYAARRDFRTPLVVTLGALLAFMLAASLAAGAFGVEGVALALVTFHWLTAIALVVLLARVHRIRLLPIG